MTKEDYATDKETTEPGKCMDAPRQHTLEVRKLEDSRVSRKRGMAREHALYLKLQSLADPMAKRYIESLKKEFEAYKMPLDEARKIIDADMGDKKLTDLLYDARE